MIKTGFEPGKPRVLFLDHSTEAGGAELALTRVLKAQTRWSWTLMLPGTDALGAGVFQELLEQRFHMLLWRGPAQHAGASTPTKALRKNLDHLTRLIGQVISLRTSIEFKRSDVVHANSGRSAVYGALACLGTRKRFVVHLRDMITRESLGRLGLFLFRHIVFQRADGIVSNSKATLDSALPYIKSDIQIEIIPSPIGINESNFQISIEPRVSVVGMVARIDPWKGQDILIRAFAHAFAGKEVKLVLIGGALFGKQDYQTRLQELAHQLEIEDQVEFIGQVDPSAVFDHIRAFDICVQSSIRPEPLGQNVLQYLRLGKPTIAVDEGGPRDWIEHGVNGLLCPMGDVDSVTRALQNLDGDFALRERLSCSARNTPGILTDREVGDKYAEFYTRLCKQ